MQHEKHNSLSFTLDTKIVRWTSSENMLWHDTIKWPFQIHLRDFWDSKYSAMDPSRELTRQLRDATNQGPSSSRVQGSGTADWEDEDQWSECDVMK